MAEPQPPTVQEGDTTTSLPASNNEDRKAAAAMDSLDTHSAVTDPSADPATSSTSKKEVDQKALGDALKQLDINKGSTTTSAGTSEAKKRADAKRAEEERLAEERRKVKVDAGDVVLLVSCC